MDHDDTCLPDRRTQSPTPRIQPGSDLFRARASALIVCALRDSRAPNGLFPEKADGSCIRAIADGTCIKTRSDGSIPADTIQSFVMDLRVNDMLERRGFDMSIIAGHQVETIRNFASKCAAGEKVGNERILAGIINSLAETLLEMERFPAKLSGGIKDSLELIQRHLPEAFEPAKGFVNTVLRHGYESCEAVKRVVEECSVISFAALVNWLVFAPHTH